MPVLTDISSDDQVANTDANALNNSSPDALIMHSHHSLLGM